MTRTETAQKYTDLPVLHIEVEAADQALTVPSEVACVKGGYSNPVVVTTGGVKPFTEVTVTLKLQVKAKDAETEPSAGIDLTAVPTAA